MNILFFTRLFFPHIGGVEKHVMEISLRLLARGHKVTIITEQVSESALHEVVQGISVYRIPTQKMGWFKKFLIWRSLWNYRTLLKNADVIHCHDVFFWYIPFRFLYPRKKIFVTFHGYEAYPLPKNAIFMHKIAERLSRGNISIGAFIQKWYGTKPSHIVYGGVSHKKNTRKTVKKTSALFFGRLDEQTGITTYNTAFEILRKKYPHFQFCVIGEGKFSTSLSQKIKKMSFRPNASKYLHDYHIAFVSRYLSILEALVLKKPVVAVYDNPIKRDYLMRTPFRNFIYLAKNASEVVAHVEDILMNRSEVRKKTELGYAWAIQQTWEKVTETYLSLWRLKK